MKDLRFSAKNLGYFLLFIIFFLSIAVNADEEPFYQAPVIDDIVCKGNENTDCAFIRKKFYQNIGDLLNPVEVEDAKLRLGSLIQFIDVHVYLEKSFEKNHVVVVFEVKEASQIQYAAGINVGNIKSKHLIPDCTYIMQDNVFIPVCSGNDTIQRTNTYYSNSDFKITNFNFLGSAKVLDVTLLNSMYESDRTGNFDYLSTVSSEASNYSLIVNYHDPHLFESRDYFLSTEFNYTRTKHENQTSLYLLADEGLSKSINFRLGRRLLRHSFVMLGAAYTSEEDEANNRSTFSASTVKRESYSLNYGWDSRDDGLLPTSGSLFIGSLSYFENRVGGNVAFNPRFIDKRLNMNYEKHRLLCEKSVLSFKVNASTPYKFPIRNLYSSLSIRYTKLVEKDFDKGHFSGWYVEPLFNSIEIDIANTSGKVNPLYSMLLGYTHQTSSMIWNFSLALDRYDFRD